MDALSTVTLSGFALGLVTAVSPCPLATNLAATAWLARHASSKRRAALGAVAYTAGRVGAYGAVAGLLALGVVGAPAVSRALQQWLPPLIGPLLVLSAMVLLGLLSLPWSMGGTSQAHAERLARLGLVGEVALGFVFALTFCPVSAALFFGTILPQALAAPSSVPPVLAYGVGTAVPVAVFALGVVYSAGFAARFGRGIARWQPRLRFGTGLALLCVGSFATARDTLGLLG